MKTTRGIMTLKGTCTILVAVVMTLAGCADQKKTVAVDEELTEEEMDEQRPDTVELPKHAEVLFDDFMFNFASNEQLQRQRIEFPLTIASNEHTEQMDTAEWDMDSFFMDEGEYTLIFDTPQQMELVADTTVNMAVVEKIFLNADSVRQYVFLRQDGRWKLNKVRLQTLKSNANASFLLFYRQFVADSLFRQQSLANEIVFTGPDPDDEMGQLEGFIAPDTWEAFAPVLPQDSIYNIVYGQPDQQPVEQKIFVIRGIGDEEDMEMTFQLENGKWKLIKLAE